MSEIGIFLKKLRGKMSYREASERSGLSHSYIRYIEIGKRPGSDTPINPSPDTLKRLAKAYDHPYENLMIAAGYFDGDDKIEDIIISDNSIEEQVFFKEYEKLNDEDKKKALDHIKYLRHLAEQENNK
jgi:transcriptional regulator with XRE-family HTH domain